MMLQLIALFCLLLFGQSQVVEITDGNSHIIQSGEWFIKAYAPWCGACRSIAQAWIQLGAWADDKEYNIAEIDITKGFSIGNQLLVTRIPTLFHVKDGEFRVYSGPRSIDVWKRFLAEKEWEKLETYSWYRKPGSIPMRIFGLLISFAMKVNDVHDYLTKEANVPPFVSVIGLIAIPLFVSLLIFLACISTAHTLWGKPKAPHTIGFQSSKQPPQTPVEPAEEKKEQ